MDIGQGLSYSSMQTKCDLIIRVQANPVKPRRHVCASINVGLMRVLFSQTLLRVRSLGLGLGLGLDLGYMVRFRL